VRPGDGEYAMKMMAQVEGMPIAALENGIDWNWETFPEYLDTLEGRIAVNAGFLVGHCALRRYVIGDESRDRESTPEEMEEILRVMRQSLEAGGLGFSTTRSSTHPDHEGRPVASRLASEEEVLAICDVVGQFPGTTLEAIFEGCLKGFRDDEIELLAQMSAHAKRPINWNVLSVGAADVDKIEHQLLPSKRARELGGRVVALTMPIFADNNMSLGTFCALWLIPGWRDILSLPKDEKIAKLRDPAVRAEMDANAKASIFRGDMGAYRIGDTIHPDNKPLEGRVVRDIAAERGQDPFECLVEITYLDDFRTVLWPLPRANDPEDWEVRRQLWGREDILIGGSDAGAHLDRMCGAPYTTRFLADCIRGRQLVSMEEAVRMLTSAPAALFGLRDRGVLREGALADVVVFDPATVAAGEATLVADLPGNSSRLTADSHGVVRVLVNGTPIVEDGRPTGATPGTLLRSGRDTDTVTAR